jgi:hypothetical protein
MLTIFKYMISMKKFILFGVLALFSPFWVAAHGEMMEFNESQTSQDIMRYIEDQALGSELHEEMEGLMTKMMAGAMSEQEASRFLVLMNEYPGAHATMMNRLAGFSSRQAMVPFGMAGTYAGILWLLFVVWLAVGILAAVWLWNSITKK